MRDLLEDLLGALRKIRLGRDASSKREPAARLIQAGVSLRRDGHQLPHHSPHSIGLIGSKLVNEAVEVVVVVRLCRHRLSVWGAHGIV